METRGLATKKLPQWVSWLVFGGMLAALYWVSFGDTHSASVRDEWAVDRTEVALPCRTYYASPWDPRYDTDTVVYTQQDCSKTFVNYVPFTVYVSHLKLMPQADGGYALESSLNVSYPADAPDVRSHANPDLIKDNIRLSLETPDGPLTPSVASRVTEMKYQMKFANVYPSSPMPPDRMTEHVSFDVRLDGKTIKVEKTFPIVRAPRVGFWTWLSQQ